MDDDWIKNLIGNFDWSKWDEQLHQWDCVGGHTDDEPCVSLKGIHHYSCIGFHFGMAAECVPCGHPRCIDHGHGPGDHKEFCEAVYCVGHRQNEQGWPDCLFEHAFWCRHSDPAVDRQCKGYDGDDAGCTWPSGDEGTPQGLSVFTDLAEGTTVCVLDYTLEDADQVSDFIADLQQAHKIMMEEAAAVETTQATITVLIDSLS